MPATLSMESKRFRSIKLLGQGTYGEVWAVHDNKLKQDVALKKLKENGNNQTRGMSTGCIREISILKRLRPHRNICKLLDVLTTKAPAADSIILILELEDQDLDHWIRSTKCLAISTISHILTQLLNGCFYLHMNYVMHRDIKPDNILINPKTLRIKITDFGQARVYSFASGTRYTLEMQALYYRAPEILLGYACYTKAIDLWSIGCVFGELLLGTGRALFETAHACNLEQLHAIFYMLGTPNEHQWPRLCSYPNYRPTFPQWREKEMCYFVNSAFAKETHALNLLRKLLALDPQQRVSCSAALNSPFFNCTATNTMRKL